MVAAAYELMRVTKTEIEKALKDLKGVDRNTWVTLTCNRCHYEMEQVLLFFLRRKFWCGACGGYYDPRPLKALCVPGAKPMQAKPAWVLDHCPQEGMDADAPIQVVIVTERDGRKVEEIATIKGTEKPRRKRPGRR